MHFKTFHYINFIHHKASVLENSEVLDQNMP